MGRLTGGTVRFLRRVNLGNYEHKEASAEISWSAEESSDSSVQDRAQAEAMRRVNDMLGLSVEPTPMENGLIPQVVSPAQAAHIEAQAQAPVLTDKDKLAADIIGSEPVMGMGQIVRAARKRKAKEAAVIEDDQPVDVAAPAVIEDDPAAMWDAAPVEISDQDLYKACSAAQQRIGDAIKVKQTISKYGKHANMIPQSSRGAFLADLANLQ